MPNYRVAVIGRTGRGDYGHGIDTVWLTTPGCEIVAVADEDKVGLAKAAQRLKTPKSYTDWRAMLDEVKPDIVAIGPRWIDQHAEMVVAAAERGIHIYMEKPLCRTLAEADRMAAACDKSGAKLVIAHQTHYSPNVAIVRDLIASGKLGKLLEMRARGKEDPRGGSQDLWVLGSHLMDLMLIFAGQPMWCFAKVRQGGKPVTKEDVKPGAEGIGPLAGDQVQAMYGFPNEVVGYFGSQKSQGGNPSRFGIMLYGTAGIAEIRTGYLPAVYYLADPSWSPGRSNAKWQNVSTAGIGQPEPQPDGGLEQGNHAAVADLLAAIAENRQPKGDIHQARAATEMIIAVFESHRQGKPVALPLEQRENPLEAL